MKRRILTLLSLLFAMVGVLAVFTACKPEEEPPIVTPTEPTVVEEYYSDASGSEYLLTLFTENKFKLELSSETVEGEYTLEGESLTLTLGDGSVINATVKNKTVNMTYKEVAYSFLLKVDYTVSFNTLGGSSVAAVKVRNGKTVAAPAAPTKGDEVFIDWYTDEACNNLYYFSQPVTGDLTLYARFVKHIDPEFKVEFETGEGASKVDAVTTTGGKLFHLPTPVKEGAKFVGWYVSQFYSAEKLSYRYEEQPIEENITLYAVWDDGNPVVSVDASGIEVVTGGVNDRFTITVTAPDGSTKEIASQFTSNPYDFASMAAGEYKVSVTVGDKTTVRYFNNKALARVSVFEVRESTVIFNSVGNAQHYLLSVVCGTANHNHTEIEISASDLSWSFKNCDMPADGIRFVVKAVADGFVTSVSEPFDFSRILDKVSGLTVDPATELATWSAVTGAKSYFVTVLNGKDEVFSGDVGTQTSFDLKGYGAGEYTVKVKPVTRGWGSPEDAVVSYTKNRLAAPTGLVCNGKTVTWTAPEGAEKYVVTVDGKTYDVTEASFDLSSLELTEGKSLYSISVRAQAEGVTDSLESDAITLRLALGDIEYRQGELRWDPVLNVSEYVVKVGDGEPVTVQGTSYKVTFTQEGDIKLSVSSKDENGTESSPKEITVKVYAIQFDIDREGATEHPDPVYVADGDLLELPTPTFYGYTFDAWYTAPNGMDGEGLRYDDAYFTDKQNRSLYAGWTANVHKITFNVGRYGNDDLKTIEMTIRFGDKITLPVAVSKDDKYAFSGWHFTNDTGTQIANFKGEMTTAYTQDEDQVLYASYVEVFKFEDDSETGGVSVSKGPGLTGGMVTEARVPSTFGSKPVTRILDFSDCTSLEVLNIPDTIKLITLGTEAKVFQGCTVLSAVNVYSTDYSADAVYSSDNGVLLYNNPGTFSKEVRYFPIGKSGEYTIPDGVTVIPMGAFYGATKLTKLYISYTVAEIQIKAFNGCTALEAIDFLPTPAGVSASSLAIGEGAFVDCAALKSLHLPARLATVDATALSALTGLTEITVEAGGTYSAIDGLLCKHYEGEGVRGEEIVFAPKGKELGVYTIPVGVVAVGERAFYEHPFLTGIIIPGYVVNIAFEAFGHITALESVEFTGTASDFDLSIQPSAFFAGYKSTSGSDTGTNSKVTTLKLPANLVYLGEKAFGSYSKLTEVWMETNRKEVDYQDGAFVSQTNTTLGTVSSYVTTVHISNACPAFSFPGVFGSKLATIDIAEGNPYIKSIDNVVYDAQVENILFFPVDKDGAYTVPATVKDIAPSTFAGRKALTSITIPASVERIGNNAFNNCTALETVIFTAPAAGEDAPALTIEANAFYYCTHLANLTLPDRLTHLGISVFYNCDGLVSIRLPKNLETIDQSTSSSGSRMNIFQLCDNLKEVTVDPENTHFTGKDGVLYQLKAMKLFPEGEVENRPYEALYCSPGAEGTVTIPGTVRYVRAHTFEDINHVTKIVFEDAVDIYDAEGEKDNTEYTIEQYGLYGYNTDTESYGQYNTSVAEIVLPEGLKTISKYLIYDWQGLKKVTIPNTVTSIAACAFYYCNNITEIIFEEGGTDPLVLEDGYSEYDHSTTYYGVFGYTSTYTGTTYHGAMLTSLTLPARISKIGAYAFYGMPLEELKFGAGDIKDLKIGDYAFGHCDQLSSGFCLPEGTTEVGSSIFYYTHLSEIKLPSTLETIGNSAFSSMTLSATQKTLKIPASVKTIGDSAFYYSMGAKYPFEEVDLSEATGLTTIGYGAFRMFENLTTVKFAKATEESPDLVIASGAFNSNPRLTSITLPANLVSLGEKSPLGSTSVGMVFQGDQALESVTFETFETGTDKDKSRLASIATRSFEKTGLTEINFPESTANKIVLGEKLFSFCSKLTKVYLSTSVQDISNVFMGCGSLQQITIAPNHEYFKVDSDRPILYDKDGEVVQFVYAAVSGDFTIEGGTEIGASAFKGQADITKVFIPASVQEIGENAFADCVNLVEVQFEQGSTLKQIGEMAFQNCYKLSKINLETCTYLTTLGTFHEQTGTLGKSGYKEAYYGGQVFENDAALKISFKAPASLQNIGQKTFANSGVSSVDLSATSMTELQTSTFESATGLTSVKFPDSLAFLGITTFKNASKIATIDLSNTQVFHLSDVKGTVQKGMNYGVPTDGKSFTALNIFQGCDSLTTIKFPAGLLSVGYYSFNGTDALESIYIGNKVNDFSEINAFGPGAIAGSGIQSVTIPGSIDYAKIKNGTSFVGVLQACPRLKKVEIVGPANLAEIPEKMFYNCSSLTDFDFTKLTGLKKIGKQAFMGCGLTVVNLSGCTSAASDILGVEGIFQNCTALTSVKLPATATKTGTKVFMNTGFTTINLADFKQITSWGTYNFAECANLTEVTITENLGANPGTYMFQNCTQLKSVTFADSYARTISNYMFDGCETLNTVKLNKAKIGTLGTYCFRNCVNLETIDLSKVTAKALGNYMFDGCEKLRNVTVPTVLNFAGTYTFRNCTSLLSIDFSKTKIDRFATGATGNVTATSSVYTFAGCTNLTEVKLPEAGITQVGGYTFLNCENLKTIDLSKVVKFGKQAFMGSGLEGVVTLSPEIDIFGDQVFAGCVGITDFQGAESGKTYQTKSHMLLKVTEEESTILAFSAGVTAEDGTLKLSSDYSIGAYTFDGFAAEGVTKLDLSELTVESLPNYALAGAPFEEIILPEGITSLGTYMFQNCVNLTKVVIPAGVTAIPNYAFSGAGITEFEVPEQVTSIGLRAFEKSKLQHIVLPDTLQMLGQYAFTESELVSAEFECDPDIVDASGAVPSIINAYLFNKCAKLKSVDFGPRTTIYANEFKECGLEKLVIPDTVTTCSGGYFISDCPNLTDLIIEGNPFSDGSFPNYFAQNCPKLNNVVISGEITGMGNYWFQNCTALETITLPDSLTAIGASAFKGCTNLTHVGLPASLTTIGNSAFEGCESLEGDFVLSDEVTSLGTKAFAGCTKIKSLTLSASVGTISANVFDGWTANQTINFRSSRFEVVASCGPAWLQNLQAAVVYDFVQEA